MKRNKNQSSPGVWELEKGQKYRLDLRSLNAGTVTFEGTLTEAVAERERLITNIKNRREPDTTCPDNMDGVKEKYLEHVDYLVEHGEVGKGERVNKERHIRQLNSCIIDGVPIGEMHIEKITFAMLKEVRTQLHTGECPAARKAQSKKTQRSCFITLKTLFMWALHRGWIVETPAQEITISMKNAKKKEKRRCSPKEIADVIKHASLTYKRQIMFAAYTGLRGGELMALTWADIHFPNESQNEPGYVDVNKAIQWGGDEGDVKTYNGDRTIPLVPVVVDMLRHWKMSQPLEMRRNNLVFPSRIGTPGNCDNWRERGLKPACEKAEVKTMIWRDLRHFFASTIIFSKELSDAEVTQWMGHHSIDFTYKEYAEFFKDRDRDQRQVTAMAGAMIADPDWDTPEKDLQNG
tara:strand:+ start:219 stop:1436 length:1218 start_codon:yes stop_codon:yes gene_type:complete